MTRAGVLGALVAVGLAGCNAVLGLGEGKVRDDDGAGGASATATTPASAQSGTTASGVAPSDTSVASASATDASSGAGSSASPCVQTTGLDNGDFTVWSFDSPERWNELANGPDVVTTELVDGAGGLSLRVTGSDDADDYGGVYQSGLVVPSFDDCIELRGASRKVSGTGRLSVQATFGANRLVMDLPSSGQMTPFARACRLTAPVDQYEVRLLVDQMGGDPGNPGGATVEIPSVALDDICCDGVVADCELAP